MNLLGFGLTSRVFANSLEDRSSIPGRVIPKTQKMVLDVALLNTQHYKLRIQGKVEQSRKWSSAFSYTLVQQLLKREPSSQPQLCLRLFNVISWTLVGWGWGLTPLQRCSLCIVQPQPTGHTLRQKEQVLVRKVMAFIKNHFFLLKRHNLQYGDTGEKIPKPFQGKSDTYF